MGRRGKKRQKMEKPDEKTDGERTLSTGEETHESEITDTKGRSTSETDTDGRTEDIDTSYSNNEARQSKKKKQKNYKMPSLISGKIIAETETGIYLKVFPFADVTICGKAYIRSIRGTVKIAGFKMSPCQRKHPVFSPTTNALLSISVCKTDELNMAGLTEDLADQIAKVTENCAIIEMSQLACDYLTPYPKHERLFSCPGYVLPVVGVTVVQEETVPKFRESEDHKHAASDICNAITVNSLPVVMLCGGKNAGKSTFCRYLLNRCLSLKDCDEVAFLECDVGQTEFTPSNIVSLSLVTQPLLGPPFTHNIWPKAAVFYGEASPGGNPSGYLDCLRTIYKAYLDLPRRVPLIVNTMGWHKGLGVQLFMDIFHMVRPTHIIQLNIPSKARNFPLMTNEQVAELDGFLTERDATSYHELICIESLVNLSMEGFGATPKDLRNLMFFAYFGDIASAVPYEVSWNSVAILPQQICSHAQILNLLDASVVALCSIPSTQLPEASTNNDPENPTTIRIITHRRPGDEADTIATSAHCPGLGIIHSIDPVRKCFYIITPVPYEQLRNINCLMHRSLTLPDELYLGQRITQSLPGTIPYHNIFIGTHGTGGIPARRHILRGKRQ